MNSRGGRSGVTNSARGFIALKPLAERKVSAAEVIARLRPKLGRVPGVSLFLNAVQDVRVGGRQSNAEYQFTLRGDSIADLTKYGPLMLDELRKLPALLDVNSDQENHGQQMYIQYDRDTAARFAGGMSFSWEPPTAFGGELCLITERHTQVV